MSIVNTLLTAIALFASLSLVDCSRPDVGAGQGSRVDASTCADDDVLETLHDAVFFLEHRRDMARVLWDIDHIRRRVTSESAGAAMVLPLVEKIAALSARDGVLEPDTEQIRAELHASPCLTAEAHERFHRALPSLP
jgi:hypothetical protein